MPKQPDQIWRGRVWVHIFLSNQENIRATLPLFLGDNDCDFMGVWDLLSEVDVWREETLLKWSSSELSFWNILRESEVFASRAIFGRSLDYDNFC